MTYFLPAWLAYEKGLPYSFASCLYLGITSMLYHWFHYDWLLIADVAGVANICILGVYTMYYAGPGYIGIAALSASYSAYTFFVGKWLSILAWDPDWATRMFFHGLIHLSTAYTAWYGFNKRNGTVQVIDV